jgi:4-hydroxybenzoate polyprenyltransferase/phosphoserine phosphatase
MDPLCVDLDGTLVHTNTLLEAALSAMKRRPLFIIELLSASLKGKAAAKHTIGIYAILDPSTLPYTKSFLKWLRTQHANGRTLILATASDKRVADAVAQELGIFQEVIANTQENPVSAHGKATVLCNRFGTKGFSYAGNSHADLAVWKCASSAVLVDAREDVARQVRTTIPVEAEFSSRHRVTARIIAKTIRSHQWVKNLLLFTAPIAAHRISEPIILIQTVIGFIAFSCIASSIYIFNDLFDLPSDRAHITKRFRPIAAGKISLFHASVFGMSMALIGIIISYLFLPTAFLGILALYIVITSAYSMCLKKIPYIDIAILAGLYILRIVAGGAATGIPTSKWLFLFAACLFISLGTTKRVTELKRLKNTEHSAIGRGYTKRDTELLTALGLTSAVLACVVLSFYAASPIVSHLYSHPKNLIWMTPIFGLWIARMWKRAIQGSLPEDPVLFAIKDYGSYVTIAGLATILLLAL